MQTKQERTQCSLLFVKQNHLSVKKEAGLYHQVNQDRCNIQQGMDNHEVR